MFYSLKVFLESFFFCVSIFFKNWIIFFVIKIGVKMVFCGIIVGEVFFIDVGMLYVDLVFLIVICVVNVFDVVLLFWDLNLKILFWLIWMLENVK